MSDRRSLPNRWTSSQPASRASVRLQSALRSRLMRDPLMGTTGTGRLRRKYFGSATELHKALVDRMREVGFERLRIEVAAQGSLYFRRGEGFEQLTAESLPSFMGIRGSMS